VNVIIPAAGEGSRFAKKGWLKPKPFIDVEGRPMIERVIENVTPYSADVCILLRNDHLRAFPAITLGLKQQGHKIMSVPSVTEGTAATILLARHTFNNDQPLIVANSDQLVDFDVNLFLSDCSKRNLDGSIVVFQETSMDPKWSYVKVDNDGFVLKVAEKKVISNLATVGIYLFSRGSDFANAALDMILANDRVNNEFYTCPVYNYLIRHGQRIGVYEVPSTAMSGLGTPEDLEDFLERRHASPSIDSPK
jgi:NDP-sugar pyrophosphorylase family protein